MRKAGFKFARVAKVQAVAGILLLAGIIIAMLVPVNGKGKAGEEQRLVYFTEADYSSPIFGSLNFWRALQMHTTSFASVAAYDQFYAQWENPRASRLLHMTKVTGNFFATMQSSFVLSGPSLNAAEGLAYLSEDFWREEFGSNREIAGQTITINRRIYCIAGVVEEDKTLPQSTDVWVSMRAPGERSASAGTNFKFVARLQEDVTWESARNDLHQFLARQRQVFENEVFASDLCISPLDSLSRLMKSPGLASHSLRTPAGTALTF